MNEIFDIKPKIVREAFIHAFYWMRRGKNQADGDLWAEPFYAYINARMPDLDWGNLPKELFEKWDALAAKELDDVVKVYEKFVDENGYDYSSAGFTPDSEKTAKVIYKIMRTFAETVDGIFNESQNQTKSYWELQMQPPTKGSSIADGKLSEEDDQAQLFTQAHDRLFTQLLATMSTLKSKSKEPVVMRDYLKEHLRLLIATHNELIKSPIDNNEHNQRELDNAVERLSNRMELAITALTSLMATLNANRFSKQMQQLLKKASETVVDVTTEHNTRRMDGQYSRTRFSFN